MKRVALVVALIVALGIVGQAQATHYGVAVVAPVVQPVFAVHAAPVVVSPVVVAPVFQVQAVHYAAPVVAVKQVVQVQKVVAVKQVVQVQKVVQVKAVKVRH